MLRNKWSCWGALCTYYKAKVCIIRLYSQRRLPRVSSPYNLLCNIQIKLTQLSSTRAFTSCCSQNLSTHKLFISAHSTRLWIHSRMYICESSYITTLQGGNHLFMHGGLHDKLKQGLPNSFSIVTSLHRRWRSWTRLKTFLHATSTHILWCIFGKVWYETRNLPKSGLLQSQGLMVLSCTPSCVTWETSYILPLIHHLAASATAWGL